MKLCPRCSSQKEEALFRSKRNTCLDCERRLARENGRKNAIRKKEVRLLWLSGRGRSYHLDRGRENRAFVNGLKTSPCKDCGGTFPPISMDFDHLFDKTQDVALMAGRTFSKKRLVEEIAKCELVCSNCHRTRTMSRIGRTSYSGEHMAGLVDALKSAACKDCGGYFSSECMDFDHLPDTQKLFKVGLARNWRYKKVDELLKEIDKCELVCSNCHRLRTAARRKNDSASH